ncbi:MAG: TIGR00730 family Rossman fold protein [Bacteroidales bacterium]|nr:TIGR00730 family Rossman fold protein [Bacteroidales bacterium]
MIKSVAVFLGSAEVDGKFHDLAYKFGAALAKAGITAIYGGADVGTMKSFSDGVLSEGGTLVGVFPTGFGGKREVAAMNRDILRHNATRVIFVKDFAERKLVMRQMSDCCVAIPGAYGTMDELFCYAVENEIGLHDKVSYILNTDGFYDGLEQQINTMKATGFIARDSGIIQVLHSMEEFFLL